MLVAFSKAIIQRTKTLSRFGALHYTQLTGFETIDVDDQ